ncbi:LPXTG cell wall anchor domain-containing protein [Lactococcus garvieae]
MIKANKLPKTGEKDNNVLIFFGIVNFWIIFMIYCRGLLKREN